MSNTNILLFFFNPNVLPVVEITENESTQTEVKGEILSILG